MVKLIRLGFTLLVALISFALQAETAPEAPKAPLPKVLVMGLFAESAVVTINGKERILKTGKASPEGVTLLSTNKKQAEIDNNGERQLLILNRGVGTRFTEPPPNIIRVSSQPNGHYVVPGRINNNPIDFLVDTGASTLAMNENVAKKLGLEFTNATPINVQTAQGVTKAYSIMLNSVAISNIVIYNVEAVVMAGQFPTTVLLGNSFLSRVDFKVERGVLVLQSK